MRAPGKVTASGDSGFTLIELLVSVAVLVLLVLFVSQLVNSTAAITGAGRKHMDADDEARVVFDRMSGDFAAMLRRADLDYVFYRATGTSTVAGNDAFYFYSDAPAFLDAGAASASALVGYRINANYQLERLGKTLNWDGSPNSSGGGMMFLTSSGGTPLAASLLPNAWSGTLGVAPYNSGTDTDFHVLGEGVLRLEICFQRTDGKYYNTPSAATPSSFTTDGNVFGFPSDLSAIVVAIVILDNASRKLVPNIGNLAAQLADPTPSGATDLAATPPVLMAQTWNNWLTGGAVSPAIIPPVASAQLRTYQRTFYFNNKF